MEQRTVSPLVAPCACVGEHRPTSAMNHWHHVLPLSWGGSDLKENMVPLCPTGHAVVHVLLDRWRKAGAQQPIGRANRYLYDTAAAGWTAFRGEQ